jgi:hypothetical protein
MSWVVEIEVSDDVATTLSSYWKPGPSAARSHTTPHFCTSYTVNRMGTEATAVCYDDTSAFASSLVEGVPDQPLMTVSGFPLPAQNGFSPRLVPSGDQLIGVEISVADNQTVFLFHVYQRDDPGNPFSTWTQVSDLNVPSTAAASTLSMAPHPHMLSSPNQSFDTAFTELAESDNGTWTTVKTHSTSELGILEMSGFDFYLSPDGLRVIFEAAIGSQSDWYTLYSDRPSISDRFRAAEVLSGVPAGFGPFMTADCSRVYFFGLGTILYVEAE